MKVRIYHLFLLGILILLSALGACQSSAAATTPTETLPPGAEFLPEDVSTVANPDGTWGIKIGEQLIPNASFDSTGLHITSLDSGRTIDIPASEFQARIAYDQELNLLTISDSEGIISAEYDPGVGQPDSPDYIPGQGWVDLQKLADEACESTSTCFMEHVSGLPSGTVRVEFSSTGIFRNIDAFDTQTGELMGGKFLLLQFITRNTTDKPVINWMVVQLSMPSKPGVNMSAFVSSVMQLDHGVPLDSFDESLQSIGQWQSWMPPYSPWAFGFLSDGSFAGSYWSTSQLGSTDSQVKRAQFLVSHGDILSDSIYPFTPNSSSSR